MDTQPLAIIMFVFSGAILLYAGLLALTRDVTMLPKQSAVKNVGDKKAYALRVAKVLAIVAVSPALTGVTALLSGIAAAIVFVVSLVGCIWLGVKVTA
jgi:hypothetical protein